MSDLRCDQQLESIFSESYDQARKREQSVFDEAAGGCVGSIVLYGAGNLGRRVLRGLRKNGLDVLAFADASRALHGQKIEAVPVFSPEDAVRKYGRTAAFVVCVWHPDQRSGVQNIADQLTAMGATRTLPFVYLFWKYGDAFLPCYFWDLPSKYLAQEDAIRTAYEAFGEPASKAQFVADLELRISGVFGGRPSPCIGPQYFPNDLFRISPNEYFVDCGGYDGDTIRALVEESKGRFSRIIAFEADPENFSRLGHYLSIHPEFCEQVAIHQTAVSRAGGSLRFAATAGANAAVSSGGETVVNCVALDEILGDESPTMIKMDIEGSELDALEGAVRIIASHKPLLAICVYHRPEHLWEIPLWMKRAEPEAGLYLRSHAVDGFDSVCYAVPPTRSVERYGNCEGMHRRIA
jgi:FkbM family methyltransferase